MAEVEKDKSKSLVVINNTEKQVSNLLLNINLANIESYIQGALAIPSLSAEEEKKLAEALYYQKDLQAAERLTLSSLKFVIPVARKFQNYGLALDDLIQEGNVGLIKAVKKFDPNQEVRLITFAVHWIRAEIIDFIIKNWKLVKVATTKSQRKLFFRLRGLKASSNWIQQEEAEKIAKELNVSAKDVLEMDARLYSRDSTIGHEINDDEDEQSNTAVAYLASPEPTLEEQFITQENDDSKIDKMKKALSSLDERSLGILHKRWLSDSDKKIGLKDLAQEYNISIERVRQIEAKAIEKIREQVYQN